MTELITKCPCCHIECELKKVYDGESGEEWENYYPIELDKLKAEIAKYQRREDEHCRQLEKYQKELDTLVMDGLNPMRVKLEE